MRPLEGQTCLPQGTTFSFEKNAILTDNNFNASYLSSYLRRTTSRQAGENGLYIGGGMEDLTGSPGSNNSGDMTTQKQRPPEAYYFNPAVLFFSSTSFAVKSPPDLWQISVSAIFPKE